MKKYVFIDLDGTLLNSKTQVSQKTIDVISNLNENIEVIISTGRNKNKIKNLIKPINNYAYAVALNGAEVHDNKNNEVLFSEQLDKNVVKYFFKMAKEKSVKFECTSKGATHNSHLPDVHEGSTHITFDNYVEFFDNNPISGVVIYDDDFAKMEVFIPEVQKTNGIKLTNYSLHLVDKSVKKTNFAYVDFSNSDASKGKAIKFLQEKLNIKKEDCISIGDEFNDIDMFLQVGHVVVVDNARDEIKTYANEIIDSNDNDGVAKFLQTL